MKQYPILLTLQIFAKGLKNQIKAQRQENLTNNFNLFLFLFFGDVICT